jgi:hypothetical protein
VRFSGPLAFALVLVANGAAAQDVENVDVRGSRNAPGKPATDSIARIEARQLPGAFGDPFRAIEAAPGLSPVLTGLPYFYVRGAPPANVGYFFDGVRVPYLFHFGLGPAVVHPALIAKTDLYKGGYPAAFGRYAGGIVDATSMPPGERFRGEGLVRLLDAGAIVESPFARGRGSALAAGRYSYSSALLALVAPGTSIDYSDYQTRVAYTLGDHDTLTLFGFGAFDVATQRETVDVEALGLTPDPSTSRVRQIERVLFASEFHRADLRWDRALSDGGRLRVGVTAGYDRTRVESRRAAENFMTAARIDWVQPVGSAATVRAGADAVVDRYRADSLPRFADDDDVVDRQDGIFAKRIDFATGARVDAVLVPERHVEVVPGIRFDLYGSADRRAVGIDPRVSARFFPMDRVRILHAYGIATQPPSTPVALPAITVARLAGGLQRAVQTSAGVEIDLPEDVTASATVFHNAFLDLNDALGTAQVELEDLERSPSLLGKSNGSAYGLELGLRRKLSRRLAGLFSYTLSRSERLADGRRFVSAYDRTHVLNLVASYDLGLGWRLGGRFVLYTGIPANAPEPAHAAQVVGRPPSRTPPFFRLDARVEKRWKIGEHGFVAIVLEALNATLTREVSGYRCRTALAIPGEPAPTPGCSERLIGPVAVPSLGLEGGF